MIQILFIATGYILIKYNLFLKSKPIDYYIQFFTLSLKDKIILYCTTNLLFHSNF
jgi:hypothetical protein